MIEDYSKAENLLLRLDEELPIAALVSPRLAKSLVEEIPGIRPLLPCVVIDVEYVDNDGGIFCMVDFPHLEPELRERTALCTAIAHLIFDPRLPMARDIHAYQKYRAKKARRNGEKQMVRKLKAA